MDFKRISLEASDAESFVNEMKFEIATARCEDVQVLRVDVVPKYEEKDSRKFFSNLTRSLRSMKQRRRIQFFAFSDNFDRGGTESVFLLNKYSECIGDIFAEEDKNFFFIKL